MQTRNQVLEDGREWDVSPFWRLPRDGAPRRLEADLVCDTLVIGAGITGLSTAHALSRSQRVVLIDSRQIGEGMSGWSAGILSDSTTIDLQVIEAGLGADQARLLISAMSAAVVGWKQRLGPTSPVWQSGNALYVAAKERHRPVLLEEQALRDRYQGSARLFDADHVPELWQGFPCALELPGQHAVNPVALLMAILSELVAHGVAVYEDSAVDRVEHMEGRFRVKSGDHRIEATNLVLCTGLASTVFPEAAALGRMVIPAVSHIAVTGPSDELTRWSRETGTIALWDTSRLYHYVRYLPDGRMLIGGEDRFGSVRARRLEPSDPHIQRLYQWARQHHGVTLPAIKHCWRASLAVPADGLPLLLYRPFGDGMLVSAVTDGLPFGLLLGTTIARRLETGLESDLDRLLSHRRAMPLEAKLLRLLPPGSWVRALAGHVAFGALRVMDAVW